MTSKCTATEIYDVSCSKMTFDVEEQNDEVHQIVVSCERDEIIKVRYDDLATDAYEIWTKFKYEGEEELHSGFTAHEVLESESKVYLRVKELLSESVFKETDVSDFAGTCKKVKNLARKLKFESVEYPSRPGTTMKGETDTHWRFHEKDHIGGGTVYVCKRCGKDMLSREWGRHNEGGQSC